MFSSLLTFIIGMDTLKEDTREFHHGMKSMTRRIVNTVESIWYAPDSLEEKCLVFKDVFADHKGTWISWIILGTLFIV